MKRSFLLLPLFLFLCIPITLHARTIVVPTDSPTIQGGIDMAVDGDTVMVLPGTYYEHGIRFYGKAIVVTSEDPLSPAVVSETVVDASGAGRVFAIIDGEGPLSVLTGFTIRGGHTGFGGGVEIFSAPTVTRNVITGNIADTKGGGIGCGTSSGPIIDNNQITNNTAFLGGGIFVNSYSSVTISNNVISGNSALGGWAEGGGICSDFSTVTITGCTITNNTVPEGFGGGVACSGGSVLVTNTIFWGNSAPPLGDQIYLGYGAIENPSTGTIDYSDVEGGLNGVFAEDGCRINWGDHMEQTDPLFRPDGVHLSNNSPLRNAGDPAFNGDGETDIDGQARVLDGRVDIGADEIRPLSIEHEKPPVIDTRREARSLE